MKKDAKPKKPLPYIYNIMTLLLKRSKRKLINFIKLFFHIEHAIDG